MSDVRRTASAKAKLAEGDPAKGASFGMGSPLAVALVWRGIARFWLGRPGWREDLDHAVLTATRSDPATHAMVVSYKYGFAIPYGVLRADDSAVRAIEEAVQTAEGLSDDTALSFAKLVCGVVQVHRHAPTDRKRGLELLAQLRDRWLRERTYLHWLPNVDIIAAGARARRGDRDGAIQVMRMSVDDLFTRGEFGYLAGATGALVETVLDRGAEADVSEAEEAIERLANLAAGDGWAVRDITLLRLRALLARARGDEDAHRDLVNRYRAMATSMGFEGHIAMAEAMT